MDRWIDGWIDTISGYFALLIYIYIYIIKVRKEEVEEVEEVEEGLVIFFIIYYIIVTCYIKYY
jgi:hypothetical protein